MYHVLVPVSTNTDRALTQAACVLDWPGASDDVRVTVTHARKTEGQKRRPVAEVDAVDRVTQVFEREGIPVDATPCTMPPDEGILATAEELDVDHIVMGTHNQSSFADIVFGSVTKSVFRHTARPVTLVGPGIEQNLETGEPPTASDEQG